MSEHAGSESIIIGIGTGGLALTKFTNVAALPAMVIRYVVIRPADLTITKRFSRMALYTVFQAGGNKQSKEC